LRSHGERMMPSVYLDLGLVLLIIAIFGLLAYSTRSTKLTNRRVLSDLAELRKFLERELRALRESRQEATRENSLVPSTGSSEPQQRNSELEALRLLILRQDDEIRILQRETDDMRHSLARLGSTGGFVDATLASALKTAAVSAGAQVAQASDRAAGTEWTASVAASEASFGNRRDLLNYNSRSEAQFPGAKETVSRVSVDSAKEVVGWKENLDGILSMLDAMEREVQS
jgi:hypothetical protein